MAGDTRAACGTLWLTKSSMVRKGASLPHITNLNFSSASASTAPEGPGGCQGTQAAACPTSDCARPQPAQASGLQRGPGSQGSGKGQGRGRRMACLHCWLTPHTSGATETQPLASPQNKLLAFWMEKQGPREATICSGHSSQMAEPRLEPLHPAQASPYSPLTSCRSPASGPQHSPDSGYCPRTLRSALDSPTWSRSFCKTRDPQSTGRVHAHGQSTKATHGTC